jgi:hypothetical protein
MAAACLLVAACGTTVSSATSQQSRSASGAEGVSSAIGGAPSGPVGSDNREATVGVDGGGRLATDANVAATGSAGTSGPSHSPALPAATTSPVKVGVVITGGASEGAAAMGFKSASSAPSAGEQEAQFQALFDRVNGNGGLLGHKIVPVWSVQQIATTDPQSTLDQATCATFTQDNHVFAAMLSPFTQSGLWACLQNAGVFMIGSSFQGGISAGDFQRYPNLIGVGWPSSTRMAAIEAEGLWDEGYFTPGAKIGVLYIDDPDFKSGLPIMEAVLAQHGLKVADTSGVSQESTLNNVGSIAAQVSSAELKFRSDGIDHVIAYDEAQIFLFAADAGSQHYYPRYGLTSTDYEQIYASPPPAGSLNGALGIGWNPAIDTQTTSDSTAAQRDCDSYVRSKGQSYGPLVNWGNCDQVSVLVAAVRTAQSLSVDAITAALPEMSVASASVIGLRYGVNAHDGTAAARHVAYVPSCSCFQYTSATYSS